MAGTTDDNKGWVGGSRKIKGMICFALALYPLVYIVTKMHTPPEVAQAAIYALGIAGLSAIGGQAAVDSFNMWKGGGSGSSQSTRVVSESIKTDVQK